MPTQHASMAKAAGRSARDRVYELIFEGIVRGDYPSGSFIEEDMVCHVANVSRDARARGVQPPGGGALHRPPAAAGATVRHVTRPGS